MPRTTAWAVKAWRRSWGGATCISRGAPLTAMGEKPIPRAIHQKNSQAGQASRGSNSTESMATTATASLDMDLDGEVEYALYNRHVAALFERSGGRMVAAWRRTADGRIRQMIGNFASYAGKETEEEVARWAREENQVEKEL